MLDLDVYILFYNAYALPDTRYSLNLVHTYHVHNNENAVQIWILQARKFETYVGQMKFHKYRAKSAKKN